MRFTYLLVIVADTASAFSSVSAARRIALPTHQHVSSPRTLLQRRERGAASVASPLHAITMSTFSEEPLPELPSTALLKAIAACGSTATAADVAAEAGLEISETRRQLLNLARLVGAELQVSEDGELLFVFEEPGALRRSLRASSVRQRAKDAWTTASPPIFWLLRASFGIGLLASLALVTTAITVLASSKDDSSSSRSTMPTLGGLWGPSPLDFLYYSTRPYGYYGYYEPTGEKGFLQSCFSLLFGDGDPNAALPQRTSAAAAAFIRANGGAVTAEQLAPILAPEVDPQRADEDAMRPGAPVSEPWMLPILVQFNGEPVVTDDGDLIYVFPELMSTADDETKGALGAAGGALAPMSGPSALALRRALAFPETPAGWRPAIGERVVVARVRGTRQRDDQVRASTTARRARPPAICRPTDSQRRVCLCARRGSSRRPRASWVWRAQS